MDGYGNRIWYVRATDRTKITDWTLAVVGGLAMYDIDTITLDKTSASLRTQLWARAMRPVSTDRIAQATAEQDTGPVPAQEVEAPTSITRGADIAAALAARVQVGGDLTGSPSAPVVARLHGVTVPASPAAGQVLTAVSPTAAQWSTTAAGLTATQLAADAAMTARYAPIVARDVRTYGAVGDGATDDSAALNAALTAAGPGGTVVIPPGMTLKVSGAVPLDSRAITGGGAIKGTGLASVVSVTGTGPALIGVRLLADGCSNGIYVNAGTTGLTVRDCWIGGLTTGPAQAVHCNTTGIVGASVAGNIFSRVTYGILTNQGAADLRDLRILGNRFELVSGDAIELNHPGVAYTAGADVIIDGNYISVTEGSGSTAGFGVGVAGATRVVISNNVFDGCRNQAIHIEDEAAHIVVSSNVITGGGVGIWAIGGNYVDIQGNQLYGQGGAAIQLAQDSGGHLSNFRILANSIFDGASVGIEINCDYWLYGEISHNTVSGCAGDGFWSHSTTSATAIGPLKVKDNQFINNTGWGMTVDSHTLQWLESNICDGNTAGAFRRSVTANGILTPWHNPSGSKLDATFTANSTGWIDLFPIGDRATGNITVNAARHLNSADRCQSLWTITWDGATLTATPVGAAVTSGGSTGAELRQSGGMLQARIGHAGIPDGTVTRVWAQMQGAVLL